MAFAGIGQLVQNIQDAVEGFVGLFPGNNVAKLYPTTTNPIILAPIDQTRGNWYKSIPYAFSVKSAENTALSTLDAIADIQPGATAGTRSAFTDFVLPINPSEITQDENFAIHILPTQGGTAVNHSGNRYKDLVISGTTGIAPNRGAGGVDLRTGKTILAQNNLQNSSGYEVFLELRNWFRAYYEYKKSPTHKNAQLIFKNYKDGEFLIIEVPKFSMKRSATNPMIYNYTITARVLGEVSFESLATTWKQDLDNYTQIALNALTTAQGVLLGAQDILRQVDATFNQVVLEPVRKLGLIYKALVGIGFTAADVGKDIANSTMSLAAVGALAAGLDTLVTNQKNTGKLDPALTPLIKSPGPQITPSSHITPGQYLSLIPGSSLQAIPISLFPSDTLAGVQADQQNALSLPQSYFKNAKETIKSFSDNASDLFNLGSSEYNITYERTLTSNSNASNLVTDDQYAVLAALENVISSMNVLLSTNIFYKSTYPEVIQSVNASFSDSPNLVADPAVKEIILLGDTSLERLALEQLGDSSRWPEIVELNQLKPPFVSQNPADASATLLVPGQKILIPQPQINGFPNIPINDQNFLEQGLSEVQKNLGIDLKLTPDFDLQLTNSNDLQIVKAEQNAAQAIIFKLALEKGDIIDHPELGVGLIVGTKARPLVEIQNNIFQTLTQDPRFSRITNLTIQQMGSTFLINFEVWLKNTDMPIPLSIRV